VRATLVAAAVSGLPSTAHALLAGRDPLEATKAAGAMLVGERAPAAARVVAAAPVHIAVSLAWGLTLERILPQRHRAAWGAAAGVAIAAFDLGVVGRRFPAVRRLPLAPQLADHLLFGATVGALSRAGS
jgi:drug/metabolite transporter superfamily protein YnfA